MPRGGGYIKFKNGGKSMRVQDLDSVCENLKELFDRQESTNAGLRKQLEELKAEKWADKELQEMKTQLDEMKRDYYRGFSISEVESKAIQEWKRKHDAEQHKNPKGYHGAIGGGFSYEFVPTSIGTVGKCVCGTCRRRACEAAAMDNGIFDMNVCDAYLEEHNGVFYFQELS